MKNIVQWQKNIVYPLFFIFLFFYLYTAGKILLAAWPVTVFDTHDHKLSW